MSVCVSVTNVCGCEGQKKGLDFLKLGNGCWDLDWVLWKIPYLLSQPCHFIRKCYRTALK